MLFRSVFNNGSSVNVGSLLATSLQPDTSGLSFAAGAELPLSWTFTGSNAPAAIVNRLHQEISTVLQQSDVSERLIKSGSGDPYITTREEFTARIRSDNARFGKVIQTLGIKSE